MPIWVTNCKKCGIPTIHAEGLVPDGESATVWYCLICGTEQRPQEPGSPNEGAFPIDPFPTLPEKEIIYDR
jgi:hypothetical protein